MTRFRICEILNVEVDEEFKYIGLEETYHIAYNGMVYDSLGMTVGNLIYGMIENPEKIIRRPRRTGQDVSYARAVRRLFPHTERIFRNEASEDKD